MTVNTVKMIDTKPSYNLKVILRETGIKSDTLRAWERRYSLPVPKRTAGGHRLYSQRDLETIKWLQARQEEGLSISRAVQLWRDIEVTHLDPLEVMAVSLPPGEPSLPSVDSDLTHFREAWVRACMDFDEVMADQQLTLALSRHAPEQVCLEVIMKGLAQIGQLWYENKATVQQEHIASSMALRRVNALLAAAPPPTRAQTVCLICPPEELHTFPLLLLALMLRYRGWPVAYFGADVPVAQMESVLQVTQPALVVLAAQTLWTAAEALATAQFFVANQVSVAYGGYIFNQLPQLRQYIPGYFLGETMEDAVTTITSILSLRAPMPATTPISPAYQAALAAFDRHRWLLEGHVGQLLQSEGWTKGYLRTVNRHLANDIRAALTFGDITLIDREIDWVSRLLANHEIPQEFLERYLAVYHEVAREYLEGPGAPLIEWLAETGAGIQ